MRMLMAIGIQGKKNDYESPSVVAVPVPWGQVGGLSPYRSESNPLIYGH